MILCPNVLSCEQSAILRGWGVMAPEHVPGKRAHQGAFVQVDAPVGWEVVGYTRCSRILVDDRGLWRARFFHKPEFYDCQIQVRSVDPALRADVQYAGGQYLPMVVYGSKYVIWRGDAPVDIDNAHEQAMATLRDWWPNFADYNAYWYLPVDGLPLVEQV